MNRIAGSTRQTCVMIENPVRDVSDAPRLGELGRQFLAELRVLVVAGIPYGVVVAGIGGRLAMMLLRVTSPDGVSGVGTGVESDDGFTIGESTLAGTYNLLLLGAAIGIIGVAAYRAVSPRVIGPMWFRRLTIGLGSGAVVGGMLIHDDGIDFHLLEPTWLAIGLFIALPFVFGAFIGPVVDRVADEASWTAHGHTKWILPLVLVAGFPLSLFTLFVATMILLPWVLIRSVALVGSIRAARWFGLAIRAAWLAIALLGLSALITDITQITSS